MNEYIVHYEPLDYDQSHILAQHRRIKRSSDHSKAFIEIQFRSYEKPFHLKLKRDTSTFSNDMEIVSQKSVTLDVDVVHLYHGFLIGKSILFSRILWLSVILAL